MAKRVLVTGGAGYIGSHACRALAASGYEPICLDNFVYGHREFVQWGPLVEADLGDIAALRAAFLEYKPDAVMHFAAYAYVGESVQDPEKYYHNNVQGGLNLLQVMRESGCENIVFSSSCATYGAVSDERIAEDTLQQPINPYGTTKLMFEQMLADYDKAYGLRSIALRYFNAAGASADAVIGEAHDPETHLIPLVLDAAMGRRAHIEVYGEDYETPDGSCIRDYIHVDDLASAHVKAIDALLNGAPTAAYNLGTGNGVSVKEVIAAVERVTGLSVPVVVGGRREGDPARLVAAVGKAQEHLAWRAENSDIDQIIASAWAWHKARFAEVGS